MSDFSIRIENLGKRYQIGQAAPAQLTLRESLSGAFSHLLSRARHGGSLPAGEFWALRDISLDIKQGEVVGLIGRNGAGKSTLLKLLSRITAPTRGRILVNGRMSSLLEVGTGFHPELSGRENIFLNGAILGMSQSEIRRKFDEIVAFSEIERFLETPVKRYSSGMYMRLAFAVAAHLEPDILIVDEVLAVGDAGFQKKCLGKIGAVSSEGRTVVFVSHSMAAIKALCRRVVVLKDGSVACDTDDVNRAVRLYAGDQDATARWTRPVPAPPDQQAAFTRLACEVNGSQPELSLVIHASIQSLHAHAPLFMSFDILDASLTPVMQAIPDSRPFIAQQIGGEQSFEVTIALPRLIPGNYLIRPWIGSHYTHTCEFLAPVLQFTVHASPVAGRSFPHTSDHGFIVPGSSVKAIASTLVCR